MKPFPYTNQMAFWHDLQRLADAENWDLLLSCLREAPPAFTLRGGHNAVFCAFYRAAQVGRLDVLEEMRLRGFTLSEERAAETLKHLAVHHSKIAQPAIGLMTKSWGASPEEALNALAATGDVAGMRRMKEEGLDVLNGQCSFFLAFFSARRDMMEYLYEEGANLYHPSVLQGLYGRKDEPGTEGRALHAALVEKDRARAFSFIESSLSATNQVPDVRKCCAGPWGEQTTLLHLYALAGEFRRVVGFPLQVADLLREDGRGRSVLGILAGRGEALCAFDARLWMNAPQEALALHAALEGIRAVGAVDAKAVLADLTRQRLRSCQNKQRFTLKTGF